MSKKAFTLAEVLITLTIIGVIAALTIPNLLQSYKKHETEERLKEAYSILSNALTMASNEYSLSLSDLVVDAMKQSSDMFEQSDYFGQKYFKPYVKSNTECIHFIAGKNCPFQTHWWITGLNNNTNSVKIVNYYKLQLSNGMNFGFMQQYGAMWIIVDINGENGPRKLGTDIFYFKIYTDSFGNSGIVGKYYKDKILPGRPTSCTALSNCTCSGDGYDCSALIMYNSWKIPDDYPVKKW